MMLSSVRVTSRNDPTRTISIASIFATSISPRLRLSLTSYGARYRSPSLVKVSARLGTEMLTRTRVVSGDAVAKEEIFPTKVTGPGAAMSPICRESSLTSGATVPGAGSALGLGSELTFEPAELHPLTTAVPRRNNPKQDLREI